MFKKMLVAGLMFTMMLSASACGKEPDEASGGTTVESQPTEGETKDLAAEDSQFTEEGTGSTEEDVSLPTEKAEEEAACFYIFSEMPIAAFEITGLGVGPDVPVYDEHVIDPEYGDDIGVVPFVKLTPGENTFVLYCFSGGFDGDEGRYYGISRAAIHSPSGSSPWEANYYIVSPGGPPESFVPEGWAWMVKYFGEFSEQDDEKHEIVGDPNGFTMSIDEPGNGTFLSLVDPWLHYIKFSEIFHGDASEPNVIHVAEVVTFMGDAYEVEENVVSEIVAAFEERGAIVQEIPVEEALARNKIIVSEESAD